MVATVNAAVSASGESVRSATVIPAAAAAWMANETATTIGQLVDQYRMPEKLVHLVLVNGSYVAPEQRPSQTLKEGDVLAIWPPIAGG